MGRLFFFFIFTFFVFEGSTSCRSELFSNWELADHSVGAESFETGRNWVDPRVYQHSDEMFGKMNLLIQQAQHDVFLQTWTFHVGTKPTLYLADALQKLAERRRREGHTEPVHIWLMINIIALQNEANERRKLESFLAEKGLYVDELEFHIGFFKAKLLGANHAKTVSVDNKVAWISGANFSPSNNGHGFFDLAFVVRGDVVDNIDYDFVQTWHSFVNTVEDPPLYRRRKNGDLKCLPILFARSKAFPDFTRRLQESSWNDAVIGLVRSARESIDIITPNLNVTRMMNALGQAVLRGVRVRILLSKGFTDLAQSLPTRGGTNEQSIERLHRGLMKFTNIERICEKLQIHWYSVDGEEAVDTPDPPANHAKFMLVDNRVSVIGSANMDNQSWVNSKEIGLFIDSPSLGRRWQRDLFTPVFTRSVMAEACQFRQ